jgi:hypothetical protein
MQEELGIMTPAVRARKKRAGRGVVDPSGHGRPGSRARSGGTHRAGLGPEGPAAPAGGQTVSDRRRQRDYRHTPFLPARLVGLDPGLACKPVRRHDAADGLLLDAAVASRGIETFA